MLEARYGVPQQVFNTPHGEFTPPVGVPEDVASWVMPKIVELDHRGALQEGTVSQLQRISGFGGVFIARGKKERRNMNRGKVLTRQALERAVEHTFRKQSEAERVDITNCVLSTLDAYIEHKEGTK